MYARLHAMAERLAPRRSRGPLDPTELVHECYLRLAKLASFEDHGEPAFASLAAFTMRAVLVDAARRRGASKRGAGWVRVTLHGLTVDQQQVDVLAIDELLEQLGELHPRQAKIVELRFFGGLTVEETARVLGIAPHEVKRDWTMARAWLRARLKPES
jgi:RNA polymerase sigma factor (TIGR02999 family)